MKSSRYFYLYDLSSLSELEFKNQKISWTLLNREKDARSLRIAKKEHSHNGLGRILSGKSEQYLIPNCSDFGCAAITSGQCKQDYSSGVVYCGPTDDGGGESCSSKSINENIDDKAKSLNLDVAYSFRDNFLKESEEGQKYVKYYYTLSSFGIDNNLLGKNFQLHLDFANKTYKVADLLQKGKDSDVILTKSYINDAENLFAIYEVIAKRKQNKEIISILNKIKADLKTYGAKNKGQIIKDLN